MLIETVLADMNSAMEELKKEMRDLKESLAKDTDELKKSFAKDTDELKEENSWLKHKLTKVSAQLEAVCEGLTDCGADPCHYGLIPDTSDDEDEDETECVLKHRLGDAWGKVSEVTYINYSTNKEFRTFVRGLGAKKTCDGYAIPAEHVEDIVAQIQSKFSNWTIIDERSEPEHFYWRTLGKH